MNKKILLLLPALTLVLAGCNNQNKGKSTPDSGSEEVVGVESVTVAPATLELEEGQTAILAATVKPITVLNKDVVWSTNNQAVATVDASGKVTAVGGGQAVITATSDADASKKGTCTINVKPAIFKAVKTPVVGTAFKFGTYQQALAKRQFFNGEQTTYTRLKTTEMYEESVDVYFENVPEKEGKYYITFGEGADKKYIGMSASHRLGFVGSTTEKPDQITMAEAEWEWDSTYCTVKQKLSDNKTYFPGNYQTHDTISGCDISKADEDNIFQFLTIAQPVILGDNFIIPGTATTLSLAVPPEVTDTPEWSIVEQETLGDVITIDQSGVVTAQASAVDGTEFTVKVVVGEYTITYPMRVTALDFGTLDNPITTEVAKHNVDVLATTGEMFVKGIVKKNTFFDKGYGTWQQVWLDGDTKETGFEGYKVNVSEDNEEWKYVFKNESSMLEMEVVIKGSGKLYNGTYEIENAELVKVSPYEHSSTIAIAPTENVEVEQAGSQVFTATFEDGKKDGAKWYVEPVGSGTDASKATIDILTGELKIAADAAVNAQYKVFAKLYSNSDVVSNEVTVKVIAFVAPTKVTAPAVGTKYKLGMALSGSTDRTEDVYATGTKDGNFGGITKSYYSGADFELVATEGGYHVKVTLANNSVKYLNWVKSGTYYNVDFGNTPSTVYTFNTTAYTLFFDADGTEKYWGTYTNKGSTREAYSSSDTSRILGSNVSKIDVSQFPVHFYSK